MTPEDIAADEAYQKWFAARCARGHEDAKWYPLFVSKVRDRAYELTDDKAGLKAFLQEVRDEVELRGGLFFRIDGIELPCFCSAAVRDKVDAARAEREEKQRGRRYVCVCKRAGPTHQSPYGRQSRLMAAGNNYN